MHDTAKLPYLKDTSFQIKHKEEQNDKHSGFKDTVSV